MSRPRYFNQKGRERWASWVAGLKAEPGSEFPAEIMESIDFSSAAPGGVTLPVAGESKFQLATELAEGVVLIEKAGLRNDPLAGTLGLVGSALF